MFFMHNEAKISDFNISNIKYMCKISSFYSFAHINKPHRPLFRAERLLLAVKCSIECIIY